MLYPTKYFMLRLCKVFWKSCTFVAGIMDNSMTVYTFDNTLDGLLIAVFDIFALHQQEVTLLSDMPRRYWRYMTEKNE